MHIKKKKKPQNRDVENKWNYPTECNMEISARQTIEIQPQNIFFQSNKQENILNICQ